jgi:fatty aldehyde decarbonylase
MALSTDARTPSLTRDDPRFSPVYRTLLSHIVTGESVGIEHYARMIPLARTVQERVHLADAAHDERCHLVSILDVARTLGLSTEWADDDAYWGPVRRTFKEAADGGDLLACYVIQDVVLESFAVTLYEAIQGGLEASVASRVAAIAADEREHLGHGLEALRNKEGADAAELRPRVEIANEGVARILAGWMQASDCTALCGVCARTLGSCLKHDLDLIGVDLDRTRARFISLYGDALRTLGFTPSAVTRWIARLPS